MRPDDAPVVEVCLDLSRCCVETAARKEHQAAVAAALDRGEMDPALEARIALLQDFRQGQDFRQLRARSPELAGGHPVEVIVSRPRAGAAPTWRVRWLSR